MAKKETAEEKLLKIIEATKKAKGISTPGAASSVAAAAPRPKISVSVQQINIVLIAALLAGVLFFANEIRVGTSLLGEDVTIAVDVPAVTPSDARTNIGSKSQDYYFAQIAARNIFQPYDKKTSGDKGSLGQESLSVRMSKYKVVGVAWLDVPESATVMIEDTVKRETHFLREGDKIEDVNVKTIFTDRVVFSYANEEMTIKL